MRVLPDISTFSSILDTISIKDRYETDFSSKSLNGFFEWLGNNF